MSTLFLAVKSYMLKLYFVCSFIIYFCSTFFTLHFAPLLKRKCTVLRVLRRCFWNGQQTVGAACTVLPPWPDWLYTLALSVPRIVHWYNHAVFHLAADSEHGTRFWVLCQSYKVIQIWPGLFVYKQVTVCPGHIWTTMYMSAALGNYFGSNLLRCQSRSGVASVVARLQDVGSGVRIPTELRFFSFPECSYRFWGPHSLVLNGNSDFFLGVERSEREVDHWPLVPRLRMSGVICLRPLYPSRAWTRTTLVVPCNLTLHFISARVAPTRVWYFDLWAGRSILFCFRKFFFGGGSLWKLQMGWRRARDVTHLLRVGRV
jgi:hypothetical protein